MWAALAAIAGAFALAPRPAHAHGDVVTMSGDFQPGTIVVRTSERHLYYVLGRGEAIRYPVGVGRAGKQWSGHRADQRQVPPPGLGAAGGKSNTTSRRCRT